MKQMLKITILTLINAIFLYANDYYISINDENLTIIQNDMNETFDEENFFENIIEPGDKIYFKRGDTFNISIYLFEKENIHLKDFGDENATLPIIDIRESIDLNSSEYVNYTILSDNNLSCEDQYFQNVCDGFQNNLNMLSQKTKENIKKDFEDVKEKIYSILSLKVPIKDKDYFDPNAMRVFIDNEEILKVLIFEELNCEDCNNSIRWYFDNNDKILHLFSHDSSIDLQNMTNNIKINNQQLIGLYIKSSKNISVKNLDIRGGKYGVAIQNSEDINITGSNIGKYSYTGIYLKAGFEDSNDVTQNVFLDNNAIDSQFKFDYRFLSSRGSQDGVFLQGNIQNCSITNNKVLNWGHGGINLATNSFSFKISDNNISYNLLDGKDLPYMRGITTDGMGTKNNNIFSNTILNMSTPNQINGMDNRFYFNFINNVKNSQIKIDQGYGSGQAIKMQAYGDNICMGNIIEKNIFMNTEEAAISIYGQAGDRDKIDNNISKNLFINSGYKYLNEDYNNSFIAVNNHVSVKTNNILNNIFYSNNEIINVYYRGFFIPGIEEFNEYSYQGDTIKENFAIYNIDSNNSNFYQTQQSVNDTYLFIYRLYLNILKRVPESIGLNHWIERLDSGSQTAASIAKSFFNSPEFKDSNLSNQDFIIRTYNTLLNRTPDNNGLEYWLEKLENNTGTRNSIFYGFVLSNEFDKLSKSFGLTSFDSTDQLIYFVERMYALVLDRDSDAEGLNHWINTLASLENKASDIINEFFNSPEFLGFNYDNNLFVSIAYRAIMNREADETGLNYWTGRLEDDMSRDEILNYFLRSIEFSNLAATYGIEAY